jgi:hypothetical protein
MTKTPGEFEPPKPNTKVERDARKAFRQVDATKAVAEHEQTQRAFNENRERLRTERIVRETVKGPMFDPAPELPDDTPIDNVRFTTRIRTAGTAAGWKTVGEIREASDATLLSLQSRKRLCRPSSRNVGFAVQSGGAPARAEGEGEVMMRALYFSPRSAFQRPHSRKARRPKSAISRWLKRSRKSQWAASSSGR